jgi:L-ascorbate metabolism protein UlaG (beta-lactamase superfamily)
MKIEKIGHCCLLIEVDGLRILTDPGNFSTSQDELKNINLILITHEHADHLHIDSLKRVLKNNPNAAVITNGSVGKQLEQANIEYSLLEGRETRDFEGVLLEAYDAKHEEIYEEFGQVQNTGYFIAGKLFYPGDSFHNPGKQVDILALPVAGPWCKICDAVRYTLEVKPRKAFPVHDGQLQLDRIGGSHFVPGKILGENGIEFVPMIPGDSHTF